MSADKYPSVFPRQIEAIIGVRAGGGRGCCRPSKTNLGNKRNLANGFFKRFHLFRETTMPLKSENNNTGNQYTLR